MGGVKTIEELNSTLARQDKELLMLRDAVKGAYAEAERTAKRPRGLSEKTAEGLGRIFKAIARGDQAEIRELGVQRGSLSLETKADLGSPLTGDATTGSYLVGQEYASEVLRLATGGSELMGAVRKVPMAARTKLYPKKLTGVSFTYVSADTADKTESAPTFALETLAAKVYAMWIPLAEELMEDSIADLGQYLAEIIGESWASKFDSELLCGTGTPVTGLLNDAGVHIVTMDETTFESLDFEDLWDMVSALESKAQRKNASWYMHPTIFDRVARARDGMGGYLYQRPSEGRPGTVIGFPVILSDELPGYSDSAAGTKFLAFGDPRSMMWGERLALEIKYFPGTMYAVTNDEVFYRARVRAALNVAMPENFSVLKTHS